MQSALSGTVSGTAGSLTPERQSGFRPTLDMVGRSAVVFGGGGPALRHVAALTQSGADVTVVSSEAGATIADLAARGLLTWHRREFDSSDLKDTWLAVAATGRMESDHDIAALCEEQRIWCLREPASERPAPTTGRVTLVGGGPGDPGMLTVAGLEALRAADVVVTDRLAPVSVLADLDAGVEVIDVGKIPFGKATPQSEINRILIHHAAEGKNVVRFKGGDSFLFGRGGEELLACQEAGVDVAVIPGVSSALAVPAIAGIPITHRGLTQGVTVISGHVAPDDPASTIDYEALAHAGTTLVLLMAVTTLPAITDALLRHGLAPETVAVTIENGTMPHQRIVRSTLVDIAQTVIESGIAPPAITVIGSVAAFETLSGTGAAARTPLHSGASPAR
ncbi:uroporphyrinogen-III C-methyltransferase [Mycolicibacterium mengxianglii]|uniref:uroporphyrinogen-III C-methyltransferase n=1 Tax=Mycolicibacterium mengxianglii TaxID=2736649 RepID=UPI001E55C460|nr:uroporphyrinogen-III C-methyltransferase [Mycolicibacterium mengxianglii]